MIEAQVGWWWWWWEVRMGSWIERKKEINIHANNIISRFVSGSRSCSRLAYFSAVFRFSSFFCSFKSRFVCLIVSDFVSFFLFLPFSSTLFCIILLFSWIIFMCQFRTASVRKIEKERQQFRLLYQFIYNTKKTLCSTRQYKWRRSEPRSSKFMLAIYQLWIRRRVVRVIWLFYFLSLFRFRCEDLVLLLRCPRAIWFIRMWKICIARGWVKYSVWN